MPPKYYQRVSQYARTSTPKTTTVVRTMLSVFATLVTIVSVQTPSHAQQYSLTKQLSNQTNPTQPPTLNPTWPLKRLDVVSPYGMRMHPIYGIMRLHAGVDLNGVEGDPVYAATPGTITQKFDNGGYGNYIEMSSPQPTITTLYGHLSRYATTDQTTVNAGDLIGYVGSTGGSTGPHLHFELHQNGEPVDPMPWLTTGTITPNPIQPPTTLPQPPTTLPQPVWTPPPPINTTLRENAYQSWRIAAQQTSNQQVTTRTLDRIRNNTIARVVATTRKESNALKQVQTTRANLAIIAREIYITGSSAETNALINFLDGGPDLATITRAKHYTNVAGNLVVTDFTTAKQTLTQTRANTISAVDQFTTADNEAVTAHILLNTFTENMNVLHKQYKLEKEKVRILQKSRNQTILAHEKQTATTRNQPNN